MTQFPSYYLLDPFFGQTLPSNGGIIYLPNISGIETRSRGENLAFVDVDKQLYYGFNPAFKDGPKTLMETGDRLETIARENFAFLYELWAMAYSSVDRHEHHPFERMISPTTCLYINLQKVREFQARNL